HKIKCIGCGACTENCPVTEKGLTARFTKNCTLCGRCAESCYAEALTIMGKETEPEKLLHELLRDRGLYERSGGGVTFSGGEPLLQPVFLSEMLQLLKGEGIHTAIETAANVPWETLEPMLPFLDLVMCDVKCIDPDLHRQHTGAGNEQILENIRRMAERGVKLTLRTPVVPGFNLDENEIAAVGGFAALVGQPLELLPFHRAASDKYDGLNRAYRGADTEPPSKEIMEKLCAAAAAAGADVTVR
ncbi:MAG: glycyl-radical enzyme activating protein, partial [Oscillospiraceae bacterium]|nr:glycyl-radical enzyme activating protein [Oscillospiraceae bacterium]